MTIASTTPYPWPYDGRIDPDRTALVITGGGALWAALTPADAGAAASLERLRSELPASVVRIVVMHDLAATRAAPAESPAPVLTGRPDELTVTAAGIDGFYGSALDTVLQRHDRTHLLVAGYGLESTVHSTVRRANDRGYECLTVVDASLAHDPSLRVASRSSIEMSGGIFGAVGETGPIVDAFATSPEPFTN